MASTLHRGQRRPFSLPSGQRPAYPGCLGLERSEAPVRATRLRRAFTLVEMLVAMALTLILVYAIAEFYAFVGDTVRDGRAMIEMSSSLRSATQRMQADLAMITVPVAPWVDDGAAQGYFEAKDGPTNDMDPEGDGIDAYDSDSIIDIADDSSATPDGIPDYADSRLGTNLLGDSDDFIAFTISSGADPFQGRYTGNASGIGYSRQAEVVWFTSFNDLDGDAVADADEPRYLYRRLLLIMPSEGQIGSDYSDLPSAKAGLVTHFQNNDVSASIRAVNKGGTTVYQVYANSLADLSRRENRFAHNQTFPGALNTQGSTPYLNSSYHLGSTRLGEDVILSNLLAFDVRVFDPTATLYGESAKSTDSVLALQPGDPGYAKAISDGNAIVGQGAYVDLNYNRIVATGKTSYFSGGPATASQLDSTSRGSNYGATYDTWSMSYERGSPGNGVAVDGLDSDNKNGVDDPGERVTAPPYAVPLRSVQVRFRVYDITSRQVRQATVVQDFLKQ